MDGTLIFWKFENPLTQGFNKQQELEYFYRYDFTPGESYGGAGLEFIEINLLAIDRQLSIGLRGKEIQYVKNGQLVKSEVYVQYGDCENGYPNTIYFVKRRLWRRFYEIFFKARSEEGFVTREIDLSKIFAGLE
ncbi:hypothetical protein DSL64_26150 [Dyadobacter luteus]|uniref:Uncharacterized protein n=1 Tax=Dyadobacter luteus TaxID=2259619 RepID=A0A3D8Y3S1_9BACT|nr:hypothetical protein [Dyadobacter luteus]REA56722.1 hypothetical protein DSL64_26150 [Dyadobacter luteus]